MIASAARFTRVLPYPEYLALDAYATGERPSEEQLSEERPGEGQPRSVTGPGIL